MSTDREIIESLAHEITNYLAQNPLAADSVDGILRWWLCDELPGKTRERIQAALALLEKTGAVSRTALPDGREIFARLPSTPGKSPDAT